MGKNKKLIVMLGVFISVFVIAILIFPQFKQGYLGNTEEIAVATKDIKMGDALTEDNFSVVSFPKGYYDESNSLKKENVLGQVATQNIYNKDVITKQKISVESNKKQYKANTTAVTLKTLASGVGGKIAVGDKVKVYGYLKEGHNIIEPPVLAKMEIVGLKKSDGSSLEDDNSVAGVVILATDNKQAKALINLEYQADIHLERLKS